MIVNHRGDIPAQLRDLGVETVDFVLCANDTDQHWDAMTEVVAPQGAICSARNLRDAHARIETGRTVGKIVLEGWPDE